MQQGHGSILRRLGKVMHDQDDDITHEALPRRWVDLIHYLDEEEKRENVGKRKLSHVAGVTAAIETGVLTPSWECSGMRTYRMRDVLTQRLRDEWCEVLNSRPPDRFSKLLDRLRHPKRHRNRCNRRRYVQPTGAPIQAEGAKPLDS